MFEAGRSLQSRKLLESFGALTLEDKKVEISEEEKLIKTKGDKG